MMKSNIDGAPASARQPDSTRGPVLLAFDGSKDAAAAIATAGRLLAPHEAVVITAWEPAATWVHYDPITIVASPVERLIAHAAGVDEALEEMAQQTLQQGIALATEAGFHAEGRLERGRPAHAICAAAELLGADPIVVGARGAGRVESALLGNVASTVVARARRPVLVVPHQPQP